MTMRNDFGEVSRLTTPFDPSGDVPAWWEPLLQAAGNISIFLTAAWIQTWLESYGADFTGMWIHWEADGQVVGGCLLLERISWLRGIPLRTLHLNATGELPRPSPHAEYNDVVHVVGYQTAIAEDICKLLATRPWSRLLLSGYEAGGVCSQLAAMLPKAAVEHETKAARYVDIAGLTGLAFDKSLTGKTGTYVRRNRRWYKDVFGEITVSRAATADDARQFFAELRALHVARFVARGEPTSLADSAVVEFHHRLIERLWSSGAIDFLRVSDAQRAIGYLYNFILDGKVYVFQTGFDYGRSSKWSPGLLTHSLAIETYRSEGFREYDFLSGEALYKRTLASRSRDLHWSTVYRDRWPVALMLQARGLLRGIAGQASRLRGAAPRANPAEEEQTDLQPTARQPASEPAVARVPQVPASLGSKSPGSPQVSVVIPSYNSAATLAATLDSVLAQTFQDLEIVVVDDGSTDHTQAVLASYGNKVRSICKANGGLASARNAGCKAASGSFIALLDADDLCEPERIGLQLAFMRQHDDVMLCSSEFSSFDESGSVVERDAANYYSRLGQARGGLSSLYSEQHWVDIAPWLTNPQAQVKPVRAFAGSVYPALALGSFIHPPTVMFRREVLEQCGGFDETIRNVCDWEWLVRVARIGKVGFIDHPLLKYRRSATQLSGPKHKLQLYRDVLSNLERFTREDPNLVATTGAAMKRSMGEACINVAEALVEADRLAALAHLGKAARYRRIDGTWTKILLKSLLPRGILTLAQSGHRT
jgi:glycosyltransferase involved in cell wall biosynthesis